MQHSLKDHEANGIVVDNENAHADGKLIRSGVQFREIGTTGSVTGAVGGAATRTITERERRWLWLLLLELAGHGSDVVPLRHLSTSSTTNT